MEGQSRTVSPLAFYLGIWAFPLSIPFIFGVLFMAMSLIFLLAYSLMLLVPIALLVFGNIVFENIKARQWRRSCATILAATYMLAGIYFQSLLWAPLYTAGLWAGFLPLYWVYDGKVQAIPDNKSPRFLVIHGGGEDGLFGHALIYDESDRIARRGVDGLPVGWADRWNIEACDSTTRLVGHYYTCSFHNEI
ncbi:MAG TPA: hypothetical protein VGV37_06860 [Aliidongia sp.]|uniref:hypothetical protein n=1 Tax=Aliidongia sp. TaxID=1914230 RepID=UPI002DDD236C|nr:hypothetical protein [Aliidongia sp.]HEV2674246.1 hypothetical protein [Aliidongia sp.]